MNTQGSLAIAQTASENNRQRPVVRRRFPQRREVPGGEPATLSTHDRFVANALALFPGSIIVD